MTGAPLQLTVNGRTVERTDVPPSERLLDTLRERLALTGTKEGCRTGDCGACTVLVNGEAVLSCLILTQDVDRAQVSTIEGASEDPVAQEVLHALGEEPALQCGYCTPGFVMAITGLLRERPSIPPAAELLRELQGNLCRCTGYASIVRAIERLGGRGT